jgi:hypothetical protein
VTIPLLDTLFKLIGQLIGIKVNRNERRINAGIEFRETFLKELQGLYPQPTDWPKGTGIEPRLKKSFPALQTAVAKFRSFVSDKASFDDAWLWYHASTKRQLDESYLHYLDFTSTTNTSYGGQTVLPTNGRENFKRNVDRLLAFAAEV